MAEARAKLSTIMHETKTRQTIINMDLSCSNLCTNVDTSPHTTTNLDYQTWAKFPKALKAN